MIYVYELILAVTLLVITLFHAGREQVTKKPVSKWFHAAWSIIYFGAAAVMWWISGSWYIVAMAALMRFDFYNALLNGFRGRKVFYLSVNSEHPALTDRLLIGLGKWYPPILILFVIGFIVIQFYL